MLPTDRVRTSPARWTTTALEENEYEIHNRHAFAHDICHNRCGCAGWKRAWPPQGADHRLATAVTCADDCSVDRAAVEVFPAHVGISFNDEIAANRSRQGLRGFSEQRTEGRDASGNRRLVLQRVAETRVIGLFGHGEEGRPRH